MSLKKLNNFVKFESQRFLENLETIVMKSEVLKDFESGKEIGAKYTILIWSDYTDYNDNSISNAGETFTVKVMGKNPKDIQKPTKGKLVNPVGTVYGDFRNQLVFTAEDVELAQPKESK